MALEKVDSKTNDETSQVMKCAVTWQAFQHYWLHPDCTWTAGGKFVPKSTWCFNHTSPGLFCALAFRVCCFGTWESCWASNDVKKSSRLVVSLVLVLFEKVCWLWNQWVKDYWIGIRPRIAFVFTKAHCRQVRNICRGFTLAVFWRSLKCHDKTCKR